MKLTNLTIPTVAATNKNSLTSGRYLIVVYAQSTTQVISWRNLFCFTNKSAWHLGEFNDTGDGVKAVCLLKPKAHAFACVDTWKCIHSRLHHPQSQNTLDLPACDLTRHTALIASSPISVCPLIDRSLGVFNAQSTTKVISGRLKRYPYINILSLDVPVPLHDTCSHGIICGFSLSGRLTTRSGRDCCSL